MRGGARVLPGARCFRGAARRFWAARRGGFGQSFGGALAPLGSPPFRRRGACLCPTIRARGFAALVFFNSRPQNRGAAAVFGVGGAARAIFAARRFLVWAAAVCATFRRRSRSARFAAVFCAGLCTVFCGGHSACRTLRRTFMPGARQNY